MAAAVGSDHSSIGRRALLQILPLMLLLFAGHIPAEGLGPENLGVIYDRNDPSSVRIAQYYGTRRGIPGSNLIGLLVPERDAISREELERLRSAMLQALPTNIQAVLLVWSKPYAVECMSITTAMAAGYRPGFCEPRCGPTIASPLYNTRGWLPADTVGWWPAMLLPSDDEELARSVIDRGVRADSTAPVGTVYLVNSQDAARNIRATLYPLIEAALSPRVQIRQIATPVTTPKLDVLAYFTGVARVDELSRLHFLPGATADHLTSYGGKLDGSKQMPAGEWLKQGATASYGTVSEPCARLEKFPNPLLFLEFYLYGDTLLEAYWKSVATPGQGLFVGEPLARPFLVNGSH